MIWLTVNIGSSSVRLGLWERAEAPRATRRYELGDAPDELLADFLGACGGLKVEAVAHRVVHGGTRLVESCRIDAEVEGAIAELAALAPLHNRRALEWIRAARRVLGGVPQVAVLDTAFFAALPAVAQTYALPRELAARHGLRRFGFHGLAHGSMWRTFARLHPELAERGRVVSLQLGSGSSAAAVEGGRPRDTSMGFSPLEGLVMSTRAGDLDPGLVLHLGRGLGMDLEAIDELLNQQSGLRGVSGRSGDLRELVGAEDEAARLAVELYCYRARKYLGAYLAVLGGADAVLVGGGAGEHSAPVRAGILGGMAWAGLVLDEERNRSAAPRGAPVAIHHPASRIEIWITPVDEERLLYEEATRALSHPA